MSEYLIVWIDYYTERDSRPTLEEARARAAEVEKDGGKCIEIALVVERLDNLNLDAQPNRE